ncbi:hypothetical protein B7494_g4558 [Chlorociboria aeruginascens]|nr:hypothetical protein B7494_g4558 [Chlorociboria aeruginascens]
MTLAAIHLREKLHSFTTRLAARRLRKELHSINKDLGMIKKEKKKKMVVGFQDAFRLHFLCHGENDKNVDLDQEQCHWCQILKFKVRFLSPISIVNSVDRTPLPPNFRFIESCVLGEGVSPASPEFRIGCECESYQACTKEGCHCLSDVENDGKDVNSYRIIGDMGECLKEEFLDSRRPIYECHNLCSCNKYCPNRVIERGRKVPLQIFRTNDGRGWGVRSKVPIIKGQYVDNYVGEIITSQEANRRRQASKVAQRKDVYLFALDKFSDPDSLDDRLSGPPFEVDGEFFSGPTRFINHSCNPNLRIFARVGDHADKHIHDLAFFAIRDIKAQEELTFDYVDGEETDLLKDSRDPKKKKGYDEVFVWK